MTLAQKIGQMTQPERMSIDPDEVREYHIGSVMAGAGSWPDGNTPSDWVSMNDAYWAASVAADDRHLGIPICFGIDAVHGNNNVLGATIFPHNIGLGAARDSDLIGRIARVTAREVAACGLEWTFAPTLAIAHDYRWGRTYESYSADPDLIGEYAREFIHNLQANHEGSGIIGCAKHWVGDGGTTDGIDQGDTALSKQELLRRHVRPYRDAIAAGVPAVMASFNSWNGDKCHGHHYLITELLKGELDFNGFVVSDWDGIDYLDDDYIKAIEISVNAGVDLFMVSESWKDFIQGLTVSVEKGTVAISRIDDAVRRILTVKLDSGLPDMPRPSERPWSNHASFGSAGHREVAREAVRKSLVLLKNDRQMLPLKPGASILVAGKSADNRGFQCGGFSVDWQGLDGNERVHGGTSVWEGIRQQSTGAVLSRSPLAADVADQHFDVAIVVIGEKPYAEGMGDIRENDDVLVQAGSQIRGSMKVLSPYGSSLELAKLHPEDLALMKALAARGIPMITVLISGRPMVVNPELELSDAFVAAWLPGSEGQGIADVLFGEFDFQGVLPFDWPTEAADVSAKGVNNPLFSAGFGLRYSNG